METEAALLPGGAWAIWRGGPGAGVSWEAVRGCRERSLPPTELFHPRRGLLALSQYITSLKYMSDHLFLKFP